MCPNANVGIDCHRRNERYSCKYFQRKLIVRARCAMPSENTYKTHSTPFSAVNIYFLVLKLTFQVNVTIRAENSVAQILTESGISLTLPLDHILERHHAECCHTTRGQFTLFTFNQNKQTTFWNAESSCRFAGEKPRRDRRRVENLSRFEIQRAREEVYPIKTHPSPD